MKLVLYITLIALPFTVFAQNEPNPADAGYPQDYFRNPVDIPILLAGNFGECRPGHFHSGIDIKTLGKENQPVHAAAEGYISRIKMDKGGFGHALYITHPNGYTTLYAHLNDFAPAIQKYLRHEQYDKKRWDIDIVLSPTQFPVKKGDQVAWSGNTGASTAPHVHFEIRNTKTEHPLNPELFGLPIVDKMPPVPVEAVIYFGGNVYEGRKFMLPLTKNGAEYRPVKTDARNVVVKGDTVQVPLTMAGIGINADDYMDGSESTIAFYTAKLYMDDKLQEEVTLDNIGYDETRYLNAYADYKSKKLTGRWVQCLFQVPGNRLNTIFSNQNSNKGLLDLTDGRLHKINILLTDDKGNESKVLFYLNPVYPNDTTTHTCNKLYAGRSSNYNDPNVSFSLDERQLYDDICFNFSSAPNSNAWSDKYSLHYPYVPLHHYFELQVRPNKPIPAEFKNKVVMKYSDDKDEDGRAATAAENGWYKAKVRDFGTYWLDIDTIPPVIKSQQKDGANLSKAKQITFEVKDDMTSVKTFSGYLDGKWICFEQHADLIFYKFDEHCPKGKHALIFKAEDENGNEQTYKMTFTR